MCHARIRTPLSLPAFNPASRPGTLHAVGGLHGLIDRGPFSTTGVSHALVIVESSQLKPPTVLSLPWDKRGDL